MSDLIVWLREYMWFARCGDPLFVDRLCREIPFVFDALERQEQRIAELEQEIASYKTLTMQLAKAEESACIEAFHADEDRKKVESALRECMAHADAMAEWEWAHPYSEKFAAYREWRATYDK